MNIKRVTSAGKPAKSLLKLSSGFYHSNASHQPVTIRIIPILRRESAVPYQRGGVLPAGGRNKCPAVLHYIFISQFSGDSVLSPGRGRFLAIFFYKKL
jgi:hypothetical protein